MLKDALRRRRKEVGFTQADLAGKLGCGIATVQNWEHGKNVPEGAYGMKICEILGMSMDELYFGRKRLNLSHKYPNLGEGEIEYILETLNRAKPGKEATYEDIMNKIDRAAGEYRRNQ